MGTTKSSLFTAEQNELSQRLKVLSHPARIAILQQLTRAESCINAEMVTALGLSQSTVSQHLKEMLKSGLVKATSKGNKTYYCIDNVSWHETELKFKQFFESFQNKTRVCQ